MNRRDFLKAFAYTTAAAIVAPASLVNANPGLKSQVKKVESMLDGCEIDYRGYILEQSEVISDNFTFSFIYRGLVYKKGHPENKKYFMFNISEVGEVKQGKFMNEVFKQVDLSFNKETV